MWPWGELIPFPNLLSKWDRITGTPFSGHEISNLKTSATADLGGEGILPVEVHKSAVITGGTRPEDLNIPTKRAECSQGLKGMMKIKR